VLSTCPLSSGLGVVLTASLRKKFLVTKSDVKEWKRICEAAKRHEGGRGGGEGGLAPQTEVLSVVPGKFWDSSRNVSFHILPKLIFHINIHLTLLPDQFLMEEKPHTLEGTS